MNELTPGLQGTCQWTVTHAMTAAAVGSGLVAVFSTPMLVALMENAAVKSETFFLPRGNRVAFPCISQRRQTASYVSA